MQELTALGTPQPHNRFGLMNSGDPRVPNVPCLNTAMVQLVAWDGTLWGGAYEAVPPDQIGRTDIVPVWITCLTIPLYYPEFTQPAIVPIPEPPVWAFALLGGTTWLFFWRKQHNAYDSRRKRADL